MKIVIARLFTRGEYTHGSLSIDGTKICSTLENAKALVPSGDYQISLIRCKQYSRKMPCLIPAPPCDHCKKLPFVYTNSILPCWCPMINPGNGIHNRLDGSILVGKYHCVNCLLHPKTAFDTLYDRIRKSIQRGHKVIVIIKDG